MAFRPQYSLKTLLAVFVVVAMALPAARWLYMWRKWAPYRESLTKWSATLQRRPNRCASTSFYLDGKLFVISTAELESSGNGNLTFDDAPIDPERYWIVPPGRWVNATDEAIRVWQRLDVSQYR